MIFLQSAGGWLRLWLVVATIWLAGSIAIIVQTFPTEVSVRADLNAGTERFLDFFANPQEIRERCYKLDDLRHVHACMKVGGYKEAIERRKEEGESLRQKTEATIEADLQSMQIKAIAIGLVIWFVPLAFVFLLGMAVKWVFRGFQKKT